MLNQNAVFFFLNELTYKIGSSFYVDLQNLPFVTTISMGSKLKKIQIKLSKKIIRECNDHSSKRRSE